MLLKIVDGGLAGCIFLVPLLMGGRQALGQLALVTLAVAAALAWILRQCLRREVHWRRCSAELLLVAGVVLLLVQLTPLSEAALARLTPQSENILPLWSSQADRVGEKCGLGNWSYVSLTPGATRAALSLFLAYGLLFLVTVQRIRTVEDVERLLCWIALSAVLMAGFALVQLLTSNGKFFWFYEHPFSKTSDWAKGSFTNRNHFAHFQALGIGPLIWWLQHKLGSRHRHPKGNFGRGAKDFQHGQRISELKTVALGIVLFAGLMSLSRGGVLVMFLAAAICVAVCYRAKTLSVRFVVSLAAVALLIGALLTVHGYQHVSNRLADLSSGSLEQLDQGSGRRTIWATVIKAIPDYALLGSGVGSHREVYPMYLDESLPIEYTHAENGPLQVLLETGAVGLTLVLAGIGLCGFWCIGGLRTTGSSRTLVCIGAVLAGLTVSVVHSLADFVWYVPACMALVALLAGCACRLYQLAAEKAGKQVPLVALPTCAGPVLAALLAVVGTWMIAGRIGPALAEPHWDRYQIMALASTLPATAKNQQRSAATADHADDASLEAVTRMIAELEQVVRWDPDHARAHISLAAAYLRRFDLAQKTAENAMPLCQVRDAAIRARFASCEAMHEWLSRAVGDRCNDLVPALHHTRRGLELCPLQGEGYLYLAELCFLEGVGSRAVNSACINQALLVRPLDGAVLFEAGREAWLAGDYQQWMDYWQRSFHSGRLHQKKLVEALAGRVPVAFLLQNFQPDLVAMRFLHAAYRRLGRPERLEQLRGLYVQCCRAQGRNPTGDGAAKAWLQNELAQLRHTYALLAQTEAQGCNGEEAAVTWLEARWLYRKLADSDQSLRCAENALRCDPNNYNARYALAECLCEHNQFAEAEGHLDWCLQRQPGNNKLLRLARKAARKQIDNETGRSRLAPTSTSGNHAAWTRRLN